MTQNTETQALTDDDLVERLRKRAADDQGFQKNNEAVAVALKANLAKAVEALDEAIYLLDPDDEDIAKETGLHRIVTTYKELTGGNDD